MGISLNGLTPAGTYPGLIKTGDNTAISGTPKVLSDGNGNNLPMEVSTTGVNLTGSPTVNSVAIANTTQVAAKQDTLVSGTNIKTINGVTVLGSGDIVTPFTPPSGVSGAIQFSTGSAFGSDAANLFWDDTNNRLGVGTNAPATALHIVKTGSGATIRLTNIGASGSDIIGGNNFRIVNTSSGAALSTDGFWQSINNQIGVNTNAQAATLHIKGSGSTSATTSLLVQNSAAFTSLRTLDNGEVLMYPSTTYPTDTSFRSYQSGGLTVVGLISDRITFSGGGSNDTYIQGYGTFLHYERFRGLVINTTSSATQSTTPSALVEIQSTTQGFLPPKMTTTQKNAIASPAAGLVVYDSTTNKLQCYNGSTWNDLF